MTMRRALFEALCICFCSVGLGASLPRGLAIAVGCLGVLMTGWLHFRRLAAPRPPG